MSTSGTPQSLEDLRLDPTDVSGQLGIRFLLETGSIKDADDIKQALSQLMESGRSDDFVRTALVQKATALRLEIEMPPDILDSNNLDVRRAVAEYQRSRAEEVFASEIIKRVGGRDEFYVELAGRSVLDANAMARMEAFLVLGPAERRQAACVLAMSAPASQVVELMISSDATIRSAATDCASYNGEAESIADKLPEAAAGGFRLVGRPFFLRQVALRKNLQRSLEATPIALRSWRMAISDKQPSGLVSQGVRFWIREQRYQSALKSGH